MSGSVIAVLIVLIVIGGITASVVSYFFLQRHRADAVALAHYRVFAEAAAEEQTALREQLSGLNERLSAIEQLLRSVG
jgi:type II secretory pathway pseudopilin PulG